MPSMIHSAAPPAPIHSASEANCATPARGAANGSTIVTAAGSSPAFSQRPSIAPAILPHPTSSIRPVKSFKLFVMVPGSSLLPATAFGTRDQVEAAAVDLVRVDRQADQRSQS